MVGWEQYAVVCGGGGNIGDVSFRMPRHNGCTRTLVPPHLYFLFPNLLASVPSSLLPPTPPSSPPFAAKVFFHQTFDTSPEGLYCPPYATFFGSLGAALALALTSVGTAYGMAKACEGVTEMALMHPKFIMKSMLPIVMAGIGPIYGLVVAVLIAGHNFNEKYSLQLGMLDLGAGIAVGIAGIAGGYAIGISGDTGVRMAAQNPKGFVAMILVMVFAGVPQLYGLIVALTMQQAGGIDCHAKCYNPCCANSAVPGECATWTSDELGYQCAAP